MQLSLCLFIIDRHIELFVKGVQNTRFRREKGLKQGMKRYQ